ncbi:MAG: BON domain-containing protein [Gammaproteobacteria bacterium]|nr:BON domain-containing protein [Gammaproteobacteria bacterium]
MKRTIGTSAGLLLIAGLLLQGCAAPLLVAGTAAGVAGTAVVAERRPPAVVLEDQGAEMRVMNAINGDRALATDVNVSATSYNRVLLLTGQVPDEAAHARVLAHVRANAKAASVHDHLKVGAPSLLAQRTRDTRTTARVKSALLGEDGIPGVHVKVVTERDIVYLMGRVSREEGQRAAAIAQRVDGVRMIVLVFEYLS